LRLWGWWRNDWRGGCDGLRRCLRATAPSQAISVIPHILNIMRDIILRYVADKLRLHFGYGEGDTAGDPSFIYCREILLNPFQKN
jgi:hypothetical protein